MKRRSFLGTSAIAALGATASTFASKSRASATQAERTPSNRLFIDADTANEIDDLFAIVRALKEPDFDVVALSSAQWTHRLSPPDTVLWSQKLNEELIDITGRYDIPTPLGAEMIMGKPWGGHEPRDSPAAQLMIRTARETLPGEKLIVASLGAVTNVASAIQLAPEIIPKIACYNLAGRYHADRSVWDKDEFNVRNDLNAANFLFNTEGLELHVMPVNILYNFTFRLDQLRDRLSATGNLWDYLVSRWLSHSPSDDTWIMWDLALITALARPELAEEDVVKTPPENTQRDVHVYTSVDEEAMREDWWRIVERAHAGAE